MSYYYRVRDRTCSSKCGILLIGLVLIIWFCEYGIYYFVQMQCDWPTLSDKSSDPAPVRAMILADTHLLGSVKGHWFDKMRREWQMHRAFQSAISLHKPDVVFVLGDLFDEGLWCTDKEFDEYIERFKKLFKVPEEIEMYTVIGNHDVGFHYRATPYLVRRFEKKLNSPSVQVVSIRSNHFILINSIAMEGDGCLLCSAAIKKLDNISNILSCTNDSARCRGNQRLPGKYSRPIILQHFPLYRPSDSMCTEADAPPPSQKNVPFKERLDCLSSESTSYLVSLLKPRAAFGGHTHHGCRVEHNSHGVNFIEYSIPSFNWRNRLDPKYLLVTISPSEYDVYKCAMPKEATIIVLYILLCLVLTLFLMRKRRLKISYNKK